LRDRGGRQFEPVNRCEKIYYKSRFLGHFFSDGKKKKKRNVEEEEKKKANAISTLTGILLLKQPIDYHSNSVRIYSIRREYMKYDPYRWPRTLDRIYSSFDIIFQWKIYENKNNIKGMSSIV
jgi:hypothetical protein